MPNKAKITVKRKNYNAERIIKNWFIFHYDETMIKMAEDHENEHKNESMIEFFHTAHSMSLFMLGCLKEIYCQSHVKEIDINNPSFAKWLGIDKEFIDEYIEYANFIVDMRDCECECEECKAERKKAELETTNNMVN